MGIPAGSGFVQRVLKLLNGLLTGAKLLCVVQRQLSRLNSRVLRRKDGLQLNDRRVQLRGLCADLGKSGIYLLQIGGDGPVAFHQLQSGIGQLLIGGNLAVCQLLPGVPQLFPGLFDHDPGVGDLFFPILKPELGTAQRILCVQKLLITFP